MWYDFVILGILGYSAIRGAMKGFVWQVAVIAALLFCFFFSDTLAQQIAPHITLEEPFNRWVAMFPSVHWVFLCLLWRCSYSSRLDRKDSFCRI